MKVIPFLFFLTFMLFNANAQTLIKAKGYVDVQKGELITPANILIDGDEIIAVNPKNLPGNVEEINLSDKILLPGFMDAHVHLDADFAGGFDYQISKENASQGTLRGVKNAEKTLMAGFTTLRNTGNVTTREPEDIILSVSAHGAHRPTTPIPMPATCI